MAMTELLGHNDSASDHNEIKSYSLVPKMIVENYPEQASLDPSKDQQDLLQSMGSNGREMTLDVNEKELNLSSSIIDVSDRIRRLVLINGELHFQNMIDLVGTLKKNDEEEVFILDLKSSKDQMEFSSELSSFQKLNICIEYVDEFIQTLREFKSYIEKYTAELIKIEDVAYHIHFNSENNWASCPEEEKLEYEEFLSKLKSTFGTSVQQCSIIDKFQLETIYLTDKKDLTELGQEIQADIQNWENLKILDYTENCIRLLPGVKFPESLEVLNLSGGHSIETLGGFKIPPHLKALLVSHGSIKSINNVIFPSSLRALDLSDNKIYFLNYVDLPAELEVLDISQNHIESLKGVTLPYGLKRLSLSFNPIEFIKGVRFPESLTYLDLSYIPNESMAGVHFPDLLVSLNLQQSMTNTRGLKVPPYLKELNLGNNGLNSIKPLKLPDSIERLYLGQNNIKTLNKFQFPLALRELYVGNNLITTLKNVQFPPNLEILDLEMDPEVDENDKRITSLKDVIFPSSLRVLKLGYHSIKNIESMEFPSSLEDLSLAYNELKVMRGLRFGNNLKRLDLSGNQELGNIDNLLIPESVTELRLPSQLLVYLPPYIVERANAGQLTILKSLPY